MWVLADKPERMRVFNKIVNEIGTTDPSLFWRNFWSIYTSSENLFDDASFLKDLITKGKAIGSPALGFDDEDELAAFAALPARIKVYRGCLPHNEQGWSWTTNIDTANFFAKRGFGSKERIILQAIAPKEKVLAYLNNRSENEIVIDPEDLEYVKVKRKFKVEDNDNTAVIFAVQTGRFDWEPEVRAQLIYTQAPPEAITEWLVDLPFCDWADLQRGDLLRALQKLVENDREETTSMTQAMK